MGHLVSDQHLLQAEGQVTNLGETQRGPSRRAPPAHAPALRAVDTMAAPAAGTRRQPHCPWAEWKATSGKGNEHRPEVPRGIRIGRQLLETVSSSPERSARQFPINPLAQNACGPEGTSGCSTRGTGCASPATLQFVPFVKGKVSAALGALSHCSRSLFSSYRVTRLRDPRVYLCELRHHPWRPGTRQPDQDRDVCSGRSGSGVRGGSVGPRAV